MLDLDGLGDDDSLAAGLVSDSDRIIKPTASSSEYKTSLWVENTSVYTQNISIFAVREQRGASCVGNLDFTAIPSTYREIRGDIELSPKELYDFNVHYLDYPVSAGSGSNIFVCVYTWLPGDKRGDQKKRVTQSFPGLMNDFIVNPPSASITSLSDTITYTLQNPSADYSQELKIVLEYTQDSYTLSDGSTVNPCQVPGGLSSSPPSIQPSGVLVQSSNFLDKGQQHLLQLRLDTHAAFVGQQMATATPTTASSQPSLRLCFFGKIKGADAVGFSLYMGKPWGLNNYGCKWRGVSSDSCYFGS